MLLGGLWHGAAMNFVVWGAYQGILLILHKEFRLVAERISPLRRILDNPAGKLLSIVVTFHVVCIGWVFFRAETFETACRIIAKLTFIPQLMSAPETAFAVSLPTITDPAIFMILPLLLLLLLAGQIASGITQKKIVRLPRLVDIAYVASMVLLLLIFSPDTSPKFIYFQF
jgi:D-alanyl-lipoteichoic acid acyltransferase DltB (MBOAT superfamily)